MVGPGSVVNGALVSNGSGNQLALADSGSENSAISGFDSLVMVGNDWTLSGLVTLTGSASDALLVQQGVLRLTGTVQVDPGGVLIDGGGTLLVGDAAHPAASLVTATGVAIAAGGTLGGYGFVTGDVLNLGTLTAADAAPSLRGQGGGTLTITGALRNDGTIDLRGAQPGNRLLVGGGYSGTGNLLLNTRLGGDDSPSDRLFISGSGAQAAGSTAVHVSNVGGAGDVTNVGIRVVALAQGAASTSTAFVLAGRAVAGLYEYALERDASDGQWYLRSTVTPPAPPTPPEPPQPPGPPQPRYRPEIGAYLSNAHAAATLFNHALHDRIGDTADMADTTDTDSNARHPSSAWVRIEGSGQSTDAASGRVHLSDTGWLLHLGSDIGVWPLRGDNDRIHLGAMAGYGHVDTRATAADNVNRATGGVDSYAAGLYATWFQDDVRRLGAYVDSWLLYGTQNNSVQGDALPGQSYHSQTVSASLESGYALGPFSGGRIVVTPLAQFIWNGYFDHTVFEQATGTTVSFSSPNGIVTRLGVRIGGSLDTSATTRVAPFIEAAWRYARGQTQLAMNNRTVSVDGSRNLADINVGLNGRLNARWRVRAQLGAVLGGNVSGFSGTIGTRYDF
ncbi:outer membrane autotransporter protein [Paraburkholderia sp. GAS42]